MRSDEFHGIAKDAGNRLKNYILGYASGATGVFFLSLSNGTPVQYEIGERVSLIASLIFYVVTVVICLYELHIDARRFFFVAKQLEAEEAGKEPPKPWSINERYKRCRVTLIYASYITVGLATIFAVAFLVARVT